MTERIQGPARPERGASEVISVVLMVAVTIVLAAMVGTVLVNVVTDVDEKPLAGASTDYDGDNDRVRVTYTAAQGPDVEVNVTVTNLETGTQAGPRTLEEVGDSESFDGLADGDRYEVTVVAMRGDERTVVLQTEGTV